ncbi:MAG TPA: hypothetical protein VE360_10515, partial [Pyrinomonadaceae bacterium]|nr:hypothetical protein [Pyrinomonadaceae bacterium]
MTNSPEPHGSRDETILILAPTGRDAELTSRFISGAGHAAEVCGSVAELCRRVNEGAGLAFLTDEALAPDAVPRIVEALAAQAPWSDIPVVVLTSGGGQTPANADALDVLSTSGNVTLIERPVRVPTLLSAFGSALRARRRQYDVRDHLAREAHAKEALERSEERLRIAL